MELAICFIPTRFGLALLGWRESLAYFVLPQRTKEEALRHLTRYGVTLEGLTTGTPPFPEVISRVQAYFEGQRVSFPYPFDLGHLSPFTRRVLEAVASIPYGTLVTYKDLAETIALPRATRAVGRAVGRNPLPLFIPCHRVVGKSTLRGFSGYGLRYKILLLSLEFLGSGPGRNSPF
ncbi:methylated-DNA--[protein]-cysteine S-methyltransferase [Candidatus Caldatribacterium sp. SIUC1]|uniref:methylated-DNA--[protein]-cysteine S-methyltransferase n=1 Tax=Candidatus Caldatribacterium sp. SIUC1 TaxID=3418365 RepID=UPI003F691994